jgi:diadenosine tetraphosphatase ApaH/serine/threonine PP2A family protein phosphatase
VRVAVLSDIHSNLIALDAVLAAAGEVDAIWHLGDVVGYGPDPNGVVARLAERGATGVRGNHDAAAVGGSEIEWFNPDARRAMEWTRRQLDDASRSWLGDLPERRRDGDLELVHGSPRHPLWEYVTSGDIALANLAELEAPTGLHGHTHVPVGWIANDGGVDLVRASDRSSITLDSRRALLNPGSVGQPRDGDPRSSFLILDTELGEVTWRRTAYDVEGVQRAMRSAGLPGALVSRLSSGT